MSDFHTGPLFHRNGTHYPTPEEAATIESWDAGYEPVVMPTSQLDEQIDYRHDTQSRGQDLEIDPKINEAAQGLHYPHSDVPGSAEAYGLQPGDEGYDTFDKDFPTTEAPVTDWETADYEMGHPVHGGPVTFPEDFDAEASRIAESYMRDYDRFRALFELAAVSGSSKAMTDLHEEARSADLKYNGGQLAEYIRTQMLALGISIDMSEEPNRISESN